LGHACVQVKSQDPANCDYTDALKARAWPPNQRRRIVVTGIRALHLPKSDMMGKCDPFVTLDYNSIQRQTDVRKSMYDAEWSDVMSMTWVRSADEARRRGALHVKVMDHDGISSNDLIGEVRLDACRLLITCAFDSDTQITLPVKDKNGNSVQGHDKAETVVTLNLKIEQSTVGLMPVEAADEAEPWLPYERRQVVAVVVSGRHMPKTDMLLGSCDPVCVLEIAGTQHRTQVQKNTYDPVWDEKLQLGWVDGPQQVDGLGKLSISIVDSDLGLMDTFVGEALMDAGSIFAAKVGVQREAVVELADKDGRPVVGHDGEVAEITLRLSLERSFAEALECFCLDEEQAWVANERRRVVVTAVCARHMPQMDMLGTCDALLSVCLDGKEARTRVVQDTYTPEWQEKLELGWVRRSPPGAMSIRVLDHDVGTGDDLVGTASIQSSVLFRMRVGDEREMTLPLRDSSDRPVVGKDKCISEVTLRVKLERSILGLTAVAEQQEPWAEYEQRRIVATILNARHLPKMDVIGLCDPYVEAILNGKTVKTGVRKNTLSPDWNEALELEWATSEDAVAAAGPLVLRVLDHDVGTESDLVGAVKLDTVAIFRSKAGEDCDVTVELLDKKGVPVQGKDGKTSELRLKLRVDKTIAEPPVANVEGRRLVVTVASARSLPKMDMLGLCDPFVELTLNEHVCKTGVRKNTLTPQWDEQMLMPWVPCPQESVSPLLVRVYDYDNLTSSDFVGEGVIEASNVRALMARPVGPHGEAVVVKLFNKESVPVMGKDKKQAEVRLSIAVEGCADWPLLTDAGNQPASLDTSAPSADMGQSEKRFPPGEGRRLGHAVDAQAKHANWTKKNEIVVNSDKEKEARLRALAAAQARSISASSALDSERERQETLAKAAMRRQLQQSARGLKGGDQRVEGAAASKAVGAGTAKLSIGDASANGRNHDVNEASPGTDLHDILTAAKRVLADNFLGGASESHDSDSYADREPYPKLQTLHNDEYDGYFADTSKYPPLSVLANDPWHHVKENGVHQRYAGAEVSGATATSGDNTDDDEVLVRARALLAVALRPHSREPAIDKGLGTEQRNGYEPGATKPYGSIEQRNGEVHAIQQHGGGDDIEVLGRIRDVVRGLAQGTAQLPTERQQMEPHQGAQLARHAGLDDLGADAGSFSSDGYGELEARVGDGPGNGKHAYAALPGRVGGVVHVPQPMPFGDATSTVTLPSVAGSDAGDSVFDGGRIEMDGRVRGEGDEVRVCVSDMRARGLPPPGEGVKFFLKLQLQGFKAKTTQVRIGPHARHASVGFGAA
jgi:hypothetical protein